MSEQSYIVKVNEVRKSFIIGGQTVEILKGVTAQIYFGDFVVILGPSGCGKSTLLHVILGLEVPSSGNVTFLNEDIYSNTDEDYRSTFRKKHIGMVYQQPNWIKSLNVVENVGFPLILLGMDQETARVKAIETLKLVEMDNWAERVPTELSSGQQQRVSLCRALINNPEIIIADEPTGNLDFKSGEDMMLLLTSLNQKESKTIVMVTHDLEYVKYATTVIRMIDGNVIGVYRGKEKEELTKGMHTKRGSDTQASILVQQDSAKNHQEQKKNQDKANVQIDSTKKEATTKPVEPASPTQPINKAEEPKHQHTIHFQ